MRKQVEESTAAESARRATGAAAERDRRGRFPARRKRATVLRLLRGEDLESVSRELGIPAARASQWRDQFLAAGQAGLKSRAPPLDPQLRPRPPGWATRPAAERDRKGRFSARGQTKVLTDIGLARSKRLIRDDFRQSVKWWVEVASQVAMALAGLGGIAIGILSVLNSN